ncbi:hypothetical protein E4T66_06665 [Sinimarinibacterium sp. CAU 1509]|uniref:hemerythrin domain-containing protein n=1 Tax=Sinimarinibacterium sp. CAU 1509 TaxID=2562283 RepID=UPI0010ABFD65|nr:hemerythrin domain-containing protein [Sinimarinibacterium sp. CAU 1509]TJY61923.1 hypothetical protein E4T66_06665 [Sinimarinibacterium sp. CAU 1509]
MPDNIQILHDDHRSFARTLRLMSRSVQTLQNDGDPDYSIMHDLMYYMTHYPDLVHHAREDLIFRRLAQHDPSLTDVVEQQLAEHAEIITRGTALLEALKQVLAGEMIGRDTLEAAAKAYLDLQLTHMQREEANLLPMAKALLSKEDWAEIDNTLAHTPDPLFSDTIDQQYRHLVSQIKAAGG